MCKKYPNYPFFSSGLKNFVKTPVYEIRDLLVLLAGPL